MTTQPGDGNILDQHPQPPLQPIVVEASILVNLINSATASDNSPSVQYYPFTRCAVEVLGTQSGDSIQLVGSCAMENPDLDSGALSDLGSPITADGITFHDFSGLRWIQAQFTLHADNTSSVTVNVSAVCP